MLRSAAVLSNEWLGRHLSLLGLHRFHGAITLIRRVPLPPYTARLQLLQHLFQRRHDAADRLSLDQFAAGRQAAGDVLDVAGGRGAVVVHCRQDQHEARAFEKVSVVAEALVRSQQVTLEALWFERRAGGLACTPVTVANMDSANDMMNLAASMHCSRASNSNGMLW
ncbi:C6 zinc finger domain protein [Neofusicoccum parvum]|uniref:C6 zinc finger domain protein n=1 Tax=Neofusicoccum parvum TaxID=310453 RepID=A0ACB5SFM7_9PEZI|nr:C6 zinc finger domain protein [Neofusicoccum parvum]